MKVKVTTQKVMIIDHVDNFYKNVLKLFIITMIVQTTVIKTGLCVTVNTYTTQFTLLSKMWYIKLSYDHLYHMIKIIHTHINIVFMKIKVIMFDFQVYHMK